MKTAPQFLVVAAIVAVATPLLSETSEPQEGELASAQRLTPRAQALAEGLAGDLVTACVALSTDEIASFTTQIVDDGFGERERVLITTVSGQVLELPAAMLLEEVLQGAESCLKDVGGV